MLQFEIYNDGADTANPSRPPKSGIGLANARAQLDRLYGTNYSLKLLTQPSGATIVMLQIPWHNAPPTP
jgi:sensor histidine kinase YesM